jgi:hypothetical protein
MRLPVGWPIIWGISPSLIEDVADDGEAVTLCPVRTVSEQAARPRGTAAGDAS